MTQVEAWVDAFAAAGFPLEPGIVERVLARAAQRVLGQGEVLVRQGDDADSLFLVVDGKLDVSLDTGVALEQLGPFAIVGEIALLVGGKRSATVKAAARATVCEITRGHFDELTREHPAVGEAFATALQAKLKRLKVAAHLRELLGEVDAATLRKIEERIRWVRLAGGEVLFQQGDPPQGAYIVMLGRLRVTARDEDGIDRVIDEPGPGEWIGEMALLTGSPRSATVCALRDSELVWLSPDVFDELVCRDAKVLLQTSRSIVGRLQRQMAARKMVPSKVRTIAVVPLQQGLDVSWLAGELARALGGFGSLLHVDAARVDGALGKPDIAQSRVSDPAHLRLSDWMMDQERMFDLILYEADTRGSEWTTRVLGHADHILFVGHAGSSPAAGEVDRWAARRAEAAGGRPRQSLILLQPGNAPFSNTARWLAGRTLDAHYHVRVGRRPDVERLARHLTNNCISLVFGGGASRGYAHIGVIRVFEELGIPIDATCGTSIGSFIAACTSIHMSTKEMLDYIPPVMQKAFFDPTLPVVALMNGKNLTKAATTELGQYGIEDTLIPLFCVSTSLTRGGEHIHRRGPVGVALRASGSVPGILPPVPAGDELLIDGGLSNNVPADLAEQIFGGHVIAIDVVPEFELTAQAGLPLHVSGFGYLLRLVNPFSRPLGMPNIASILMRTMTTSTQGLRRASELSRCCALYLRPHVSRWNMLDFGAADAIAMEGDRGTRPAIAAWWQQQQPRLVPWL